MEDGLSRLIHNNKIVINIYKGIGCPKHKCCPPYFYVQDNLTLK